MIKAAICDDEKVFGEKLKDLVGEYLKKRGEEFQIDSYSSGIELTALEDKVRQYDIVFLDINMEEQDGIETAKKIRSFSDDIYIVFVTAFINYTLKGYEVGAFRYLMKNVPNFNDSLEECMDSFFKKMNISLDEKNYWFIEGELSFYVKNLVYVESHLHNLDFYIKGKGIQIYHLQSTLNRIEQELNNEMFVRIHQSYLVNLAYVDTIDKDHIVLRDKIKLPVSRSQYKNVYNRVFKYKGSV